jgi:hypothetical protein
MTRRHCPYCGRRCHGRTCRDCADLGTGLHEAGNRPAVAALDPRAHADRLPTMRDELREAKRQARALKRMMRE